MQLLYYLSYIAYGRIDANPRWWSSMSGTQRGSPNVRRFQHREPTDITVPAALGPSNFRFRENRNLTQSCNPPNVSNTCINYIFIYKLCINIATLYIFMQFHSPARSNLIRTLKTKKFRWPYDWCSFFYRIRLRNLNPIGRHTYFYLQLATLGRAVPQTKCGLLGLKNEIAGCWKKSMWIEIPILGPHWFYKLLSLRKYVAWFWLLHRGILALWIHRNFKIWYHDKKNSN